MRKNHPCALPANLAKRIAVHGVQRTKSVAAFGVPVKLNLVMVRNFTLKETLLAKQAYEKVLKQAGHTARHYHADNGWFSDKGFYKDIDDKGQEITFCGVGAHHQNGIIENRNKQLTLGACTLLLHDMRHWPHMVDSLFWPFAMKAMAKQMNSLHVNSEGQTPESIMYGIDLETIPVKNFYTLFCPVYVLDHRLQSAGRPGPPKWEPRSHIGVPSLEANSQAEIQGQT